MRSRLPLSFTNPITLLGLSISAISFIIIVFLATLEYFEPEPNPYMGILAFIILPSVLLTGLAIAVFGVWREHRLAHLGRPIERRLPTVDLNDPKHRAAVVLVTVGGLSLVLVSSFGSFRAYEAMESDAFCGTACHTPMEPEYTAYQNSPHAKVGCVKCHIGSGAGWFVKSKLSGSYQLYSVTFNKFPRPIQTPIHNLRPAQDTCEQCHWPSQFFSEKLMANTYYATVGQKHVPWKLDLLIRIGGGNKEAGPTSGIHWHMNIRNKVTYVATDQKRQVIPWVQVEHPDGSKRTYRSTEAAMTAADSAAGETRRMDCIDCHNRPAHQYRPPMRMVNHLMTLGWIDPELPSAKDLAVHVLEEPYSTAKIAADSIRIAIEEYYAQTFPAVYRDKRPAIERMITEVQGLYAKNYFPSMKTDWKNFPDNIGHMYFPGCFRCHDGKHVADDGRVLSKDCNICHSILAQQPKNADWKVSLSGVKYEHPVDVGRDWLEAPCHECHSSPSRAEEAKAKARVAAGSRR
jgi:nitrate/TMAO reductase-like tetraheme cytochrome c subunit